MTILICSTSLFHLCACYTLHRYYTPIFSSMLCRTPFTGAVSTFASSSITTPVEVRPISAANVVYGFHEADLRGVTSSIILSTCSSVRPLVSYKVCVSVLSCSMGVGWWNYRHQEIGEAERDAA